MFFYDFEVLDNFIKNNLLETIKYEENKLNKIIDLYIIKKDKISEVIPDIDLIIKSEKNFLMLQTNDVFNIKMYLWLHSFLEEQI